MTLDDEDKAIVALLANDARTRITALARKVGLSATAVRHRIKRLEEAGQILGYGATVRGEANVDEIERYMLILTKRNDRKTRNRIETLLKRCPGVMCSHLVEGDYSYAAIISKTFDSDHYAELVHAISDVAGVDRTVTVHVMRHIK
jgi:DNA-binding Lrp family transcriptional regulator